MTNQQLILEAIENRKTIAINYKGGERVIEPFTLGYHKSTGNLILRAFFLDGYSSSGEYYQWKIYRLDNISNVKVLNQPIFFDRDGYNPNDSDMSEILATI
ncbi:WYL domain-containing protein [Lewinella sp. IMCC34191]|uniref:WYL domain-containing protein n=1 Tax=Lewinella sp. IMCC34191 TaxID=2259172 RepID=UPI000E254680|nr:WYL domain-containing protein [Lewinella sp. IMCC34191]